MSLTYGSSTIDITILQSDLQVKREKIYNNYPPADGMEVKLFGKTGRMISIYSRFKSDTEIALRTLLNTWVEYKNDGISRKLTYGNNYINETSNWILDDMIPIRKFSAMGKHYFDYTLTFIQTTDS